MTPHWRRLWRAWPLSAWATGYGRPTLLADLGAAAIVTVMLIPQSLAYALLAGVPAQVGLYASVAPLLLYALLGSSRVLAVGPVAVVSLMTAAAVQPVVQSTGLPPTQVVALLALLSGLILGLMGLLRLGFLASFLSHPVVSGFINASALLIVASQLRPLLGVNLQGHSLWDMALNAWQAPPTGHAPTAVVGGASLLALWAARRWAQPLALGLGLSPGGATALARSAPVLVIGLATVAVAAAGSHAAGVLTVGAVPAGLPPWRWPEGLGQVASALWMPALLISVVGFVESVSVGQTLAAKRRQRIEPNQELWALGAANVGSAFSGGLPVTGGFSRTVVNFDAGAQTPAAGLFTALGLLLALGFATPVLAAVPQATLAATIVVAVLGMLEGHTARRAWRHSRADFWAFASTLVVTLWHGVEAGLVAGVSWSLLTQLWRSSHPHLAEVGWVPGTEHYRNTLRHAVRTSPKVLGLRMDESLYFANVGALVDRVYAALATRPELRHVVLQCSAINDIDTTALEALEALHHRLEEAGLQLHFSEVKGPLSDRLSRTPLWPQWRARVHLTHHRALQALAPDLFAPDTPSPTR